MLINNEYSRAADSRGGDFPPFAFINNWGTILNTNFQESFSYCSHIHNLTYFYTHIIFRTLGHWATEEDLFLVLWETLTLGLEVTPSPVFCIY